mmetsp:Transcript_78301/g.224397  ORF Transcript_78301/g.224397 Transcript_78301/m.224397 type:complete len:215 (+) Transcript_78301:376-1020(+)
MRWPLPMGCGRISKHGYTSTEATSETTSPRGGSSSGCRGTSRPGSNTDSWRSTTPRTSCSSCSRHPSARRTCSLTSSWSGKACVFAMTPRRFLRGGPPRFWCLRRSRAACVALTSWRPTFSRAGQPTAWAIVCCSGALPGWSGRCRMLLVGLGLSPAGTSDIRSWPGGLGRSGMAPTMSMTHPSRVTWSSPARLHHGRGRRMAGSAAVESLVTR